MPTLLGCVDVLVLPSRLEGLPLVAIEAMQCGARVVATDVVGTAEAVGSDNAVDITLADWPERMAARAAAMLRGEVSQELPAHISWRVTAEREAQIYAATDNSRNPSTHL